MPMGTIKDTTAIAIQKEAHTPLRVQDLTPTCKLPLEGDT
jgi:hypothetical protein